MKIELEQVEPAEIESRSMEIIESELPHEIDPKLAPIIKRAVHTAADFDYVDNLCFSEDVVEKAFEAIKNGACIVTDTNMAKAGINKAELKRSLASVELPRAVVLTRKSRACLAEAVEHIVREDLDVECCGRCSGNKRSQAVYRRLDDDVCRRENAGLEARGNADLKDPLEY